MAKPIPIPKVFIGSSSEAKEIALTIQNELSDIADLVPWSQGIFRVGSVPLENLISALAGYDFAIFVFSPDDVTTMRDTTSHTVRDNVLFELGLFIGKLGSQRSFFVAPRRMDGLHLPSDLSGILPALYDSHDTNMQHAVAHACYEMRKIIKELGPLHHGREMLYDSARSDAPAHFRGVEGREYKDGKPVGDKGLGSLIVDSSGNVKVDRTNTSGRFEIQLRRQGPKNPSFLKRYSPPQRVLCVNCEARAEGGEHTLRFVVKDQEKDTRLAEEKKIIKPAEWTELAIYLWVDSTKDVLFRIDDLASQAPSTVIIRKLVITDENT